MALVAISDIESRLQRELSGDEEEDARNLATGYQVNLEALLGRSVEQRTFMEAGRWPPADIDWHGAGRYYVRRGPIVSVTSVTIGGALQEVTNYAVHRDSVEMIAYGTTPSSIVVEYVGGHDAETARPAKTAVVGRVCRMLARHADEDEGVETSAVEGHSVKWTPDDFTEGELRDCDRLRSPDLVG